MLSFRATTATLPPMIRKFGPQVFTDPTAETVALIHRLADSLSKKFAAQFVGGLDAIKLNILKQQLITALLQANLSSAYAAIPWPDFSATLTPIVEGALAQAVSKTATALMSPNDIRLGLKFDITNPRAMEFARSRAAELVTRITEDTRLIIRDIVDRAFVEGFPPAKAARMIEQHIGLLPQHAKAVENLRLRLIADGKTAAHVQKLTEAYTRKLLRYRATNIARTETMRASNEGQDILWRERAVKGLFDISTARRQWIATRIEACPICVELNGKTAAFGESFPGGYEMPPAHASCVTGDTLILAQGITAVSQREYSGPICIIRTASGKELHASPNHPILTPHGWVPASKVYEVGSVISQALSEREVFRNVDNQNMPARIEDIAEAFRCRSGVLARPVPVAAPDFHGDGPGSNVAVIYAERLLRNEPNSAPGQCFAQDSFIGRRHAPDFFHAQRSRGLFRNRINLASHGDMSSGNLSGPLLCGHLRPSQDFGLALSAALNSGFAENAANYSARGIEINRELKLRSTGDISSNDLFSRQIFGPDWDSGPIDTGIGENLDTSRLADAESLAKFCQSFALTIATDKVLSVDVRFDSCHIYNLETDLGMYAANGIITHNCRCTLGLVTE